MLSILLGLVFVFFNHSIFLKSGGEIGIWPSFLGFILIAVGIEEICSDSKILKMITTWEQLLAFYAVVYWIINAIEPEKVTYNMYVAMDWILLVATAVIILLLVLGINQVAKTREMEYNNTLLLVSFIIFEVADVMKLVTSWYAYFAGSEYIIMAIMIVAEIIMIVAMLKARKAYNATARIAYLDEEDDDNATVAGV